MKKTYILMLIALCAGSCQVSDPSPKVVEWDDLRDYSILKMGECVTMPTEVLETAIELDAYLMASDEEKMTDALYGMVSYYGENTYGIRGNGNTYFTVDTKGESIWEPGARWVFAEINCYEIYSETDVYVDCQYNLNVGGILIKDESKDSTWRFIYSDRVNSEIKMMESDSLYCWHVTGTCREDSENGMSSVSATASEGMKVFERIEGAGTSYPYKANSYSGSFATEIFRQNDKTDFCHLDFRPGFSTGVTTSRSE